MKKAILLLNMGGPSSVDEVEVFLNNMFADKNILPTNFLMRKIIASFIIHNRLEEAKDNYRQIGGKSPLSEISQSLSSKVEQKSGITTTMAMRYVPMFATQPLKQFMDDEIQELILFPMYPQYSTTTTLSSLEDIQDRCKTIGFEPTIKIIEPYYDDPLYVDIQVDEIIRALAQQDPKDITLILSAHGLPIKIINAGDPYQIHVEVNAALIKKELQDRKIIFKNIILAYQSKVGAGAWLKPNIVDVLRNPTSLHVLISPVAFTIDNSETIYELDIEHKEIADKIGYKSYTVAKCPNDSDKFAEFIAHKIMQ